MPSRQRTRTIMTPMLQGSDSWVKVKAITSAEARAFQTGFRELMRESEDIQVQLEALEDTPESDALAEPLEKRLREIDHESSALFAEFTVDWNWVDDDDKELPKPHNNPEVFELLTTLELQFIGNAIGGNDEANQKKGTRSRRR